MQTLADVTRLLDDNFDSRYSQEPVTLVASNMNVEESCRNLDLDRNIGKVTNGPNNKADFSTNEAHTFDVDPGLGRQRFLQLIAGLKGEEAYFTMHEKTSVTGNLEAINDDGSIIAVSSLETPIGQQNAALIRTTDVISFKVTAYHN